MDPRGRHRLPTRPATSVVVASAIVLLAFAGCTDGLGPVTQVGDNLDFEPLSNVTCAFGYPVQINPSFPQPFTSGGANSCLLLTFFPGAQPGAGVVVSANIKVGAGTVPGPMRFVRMRILQQNLLSGPNRACCSVEEYGQIFTPTPGVTTVVPLNFTMTSESPPAPNDLVTIAAGDLVGLEVLAPNVPIPGIWVNNGGGVLSLPNYLWLPAMSARGGTGAPTQNLRSEGSYSGFLPSFNLNFRAR